MSRQVLLLNVEPVYLFIGGKWEMIILNKVSKDYINDFDIVKAINIKELIIREKEQILFIGASGCGKTTLFNLISGIIIPDKGCIEINGVDITAFKEDERDVLRADTIGYIFQDFNLFDHLTVKQNIVLPMFFGHRKNEKNKEKIVSKLIEQVGLKNKSKQKIRTLSGGEKQRVAIARCLINNPKIILADEPTGNLDYKTGQKIMDLLKRVANEIEATLLVISHDTKQVKLFDRVINIEDLNRVGES